jgi:hypothetical protein
MLNGCLADLAPARYPISPRGGVNPTYLEELLWSRWNAAFGTANGPRVAT